MTAERDLDRLLATLDVERRDGVFTFVSGDGPRVAAAAAATVHEAEGPTYVVTVEVARQLGIAVGFAAAWLTLTVHSALDAVGLTAAVSGALAERGIACNVLAGYHHDHVLVPVDRADEAIAAIRALG